jgi:[acyl-carrier-protein] S-malonyltransferase
MGRPWVEHESWELVDEASEVCGRDVGRLLLDADADELKDTRNAQLMTFVSSLMVLDAVERLGIEPSFCAGHSLGEYTALVAAGALAFEDALPLVRLRAQAMQEAVPQGEGAMAAILGLDEDAVRLACAESAQGQVVEAVNFNAPGQIVIAGHAGAVERAVAAAKARGAKRAVPLPVSAPFHSSLLAPAAARLKERLASIEVRPPRIPVVNNVDAQVYGEPERIKDALVRQADHPVRWVECVRAIARQGVTHVAECGPGRILAPLVRRIAEDAQGYALVDRESMEQTLAELRGA